MICHCSLGSAKTRNSQIMTEFENIGYQRLWTRATETAVWDTHNYAEYSKFTTDKAPYQVSKSKSKFYFASKLNALPKHLKQASFHSLELSIRQFLCALCITNKLKMCHNQRMIQCFCISPENKCACTHKIPRVS